MQINQVTFFMLPKKMRYKIDKSLLEKGDFVELAKQINSKENTRIYNKLKIFYILCIFWLSLTTIAVLTTFIILMLYYKNIDGSTKSTIFFYFIISSMISVIISIFFLSFFNTIMGLDLLRYLRLIYKKSSCIQQSLDTRFTAKEIQILTKCTLDLEEATLEYQDNAFGSMKDLKKSVILELLPFGLILLSFSLSISILSFWFF